MPSFWNKNEEGENVNYGFLLIFKQLVLHDFT